MKKVVEVAIGLLNYQGQILVGWRNENQHQGGKSEFPGGKVEVGETPEYACMREIKEEVGIQLSTLKLFEFVQHEYDDLIVKLWFYEADVSLHQLADIQAPWHWIARTELKRLNFPSANRGVIERLNWSQNIKIVTQLSDAIQAVKDDKLSYWRLQATDYPQAIEQLIIMHHQAPEQLSQIIVNQALYEQLPHDVQQHIFAIHLTNTQLLNTKQLKYEQKNHIAACHNEASVEHAQNMGCHAIFISPVLRTDTHPEAQPIGWENFNTLAKTFKGLSYALGGQTPENLAIAQQYGAYGVAGIRSF